MPRRDLPLRGHRDECTTTTCYCYDQEYGDPMCSGCWKAGCFCECDRDYADDEYGFDEDYRDPYDYEGEESELPCMGEGCPNPHPDHNLSECVTVEMCEAQAEEAECEQKGAKP